MKALTSSQYNNLLIGNGFTLLTNGSNLNLLFRGCHIAELNPDTSLSLIQGRPEDRSYDGNVLHLSSSYNTGYSYSTTNSSRNREDNRVCVVAYNKDLLCKYGKYDMNERWECNDDVKYMSQIYSTIEFIIYGGRIYNINKGIVNIKDVLSLSIISNSNYSNNILIGNKEEVYIVATCSSLILFYIKYSKGRFIRYEYTRTVYGKPFVDSDVFDSNIHKYINANGYMYKSMYNFRIYKTSNDVPSDVERTIDCGKNGLHYIFYLKDNDKCMYLLEPVYPIKIDDRRYIKLLLVLYIDDIVEDVKECIKKILMKIL